MLGRQSPLKWRESEREITGDGRPGSIEEASRDEPLGRPVGKAPLWHPGCVPDDCVGFLRLSALCKRWHCHSHGAFVLNHEMLGLTTTDQASHHPLYLHLAVVNAQRTLNPRRRSCKTGCCSATNLYLPVSMTHKSSRP